jgi:hypothetical protein
LTTNQEHNLKLTTITVRDQKFEVEVDTYGNFTTEFNGSRISADTLSELTDKLKAAAKKATAKLSIPIVSLSGERGTITGVHGSNGNLLVTWENGTKTQTRSYYDWLQPMDDATLSQYRQALAAEKKASEVVRNWKTKFYLSNVTIKDIINKATEGI